MRQCTLKYPVGSHTSVWEECLSLKDIFSGVFRIVRKMLESERVVEEHRGKENSARGFSLLSITLAAAMIAVGNLYW